MKASSVLWVRSAGVYTHNGVLGRISRRLGAPCPAQRALLLCLTSKQIEHEPNKEKTLRLSTHVAAEKTFISKLATNRSDIHQTVNSKSNSQRGGEGAARENGQK